MKTIFKTVVGSHAWSMNTPRSDTDVFEVFVFPTKEILKGNQIPRSKHIITEKGDISKHEIGTVIHQILKGNFNFIVGVCSPVVVFDKGTYLARLREITMKNLAKNIYHSTVGLAKHNYKKFIINKTIKEQYLLQKKKDLIVRSLKFGTHALEGKIIFEPSSNSTDEDIDYWMDEIKIAYENSSLPEAPPEEDFKEYLLRVRLDDLENLI